MFDRVLNTSLCYVMLCIPYLQPNHKNRLQKTNKYRPIDATLTPGDQMWSFVAAAVAVVTTYPHEAEVTTTTTTTETKNNTVQV